MNNADGNDIQNFNNLSLSKEEIYKLKIEQLEMELCKYKASFSGSLDVIMITDGAEGIILDINESCMSVLGYLRDELLGKHFSILFEDENIGNQEIHLDKLQMFGPVISKRNVRKKDGKVIPMDLYITVVDWCSRKVILTNFRDVSERSKAEREIERMNEELSAMNKSKDRFFSIIAHDLRSPFTGLLGLLDYVIEEYESLEKAEALDLIKESNESAKRVFALLQNLLQWSWISIGKIKIEPVTMNLSQAVEDVISLLKLNAEEKQISFKININENTEIYFDYNSFRSIIQNLIGNAIKFTHIDGSVEIKSFDLGNEVELNISDSGIGMSEDDLEKLFKVGEKSSTSGTNNEKGTGLGLILCYELIQKNKGKIFVRSKLGMGTTFTIILPKN